MHHNRYNNYHGGKGAFLGKRPGQVAPAWKNNPASTSQLGSAAMRNKAATTDPGSKILLSRLPTDVGDAEVEELFKKTVGPLKESFVIYNSQGLSKGMAVVTFQRAADAAVARTKYNGKIVDGKRPIKIEIVTDTEIANPSAPTSKPAPSLLNRLGGVAGGKPAVNGTSVPPAGTPTRPRKIAQQTAKTGGTMATSGKRKKKGPRRVNKKMTAAELDQEMDDYRASA